MEVLSFLKKRNNYFLFLSIAVVLYGITAYTSDGFYQADEHFQIIEFARFKLGKISPDSLPWEFHEKMRPTLQPMIAYGVFSILEAVGVDNPYTKAFVLRLLTVLLALVAIHRFVKVTENQVHGSWAKRCYYFLAFFLYFLPYINVRFSSEAWSGLFLLLGASYALRKKINYYIFGVLLGLAFLFRFQISFAVLGLFLYLYVSKTSGLSDLLKALTGILLVVLLGIALDSWFYGEFVISQWNYVYQNVVLGKAATFGVSPWYSYFFILYYVPLCTGIGILLAFVILLRYQPKHLLVWIVISSVLIHSLVGRKDIRFLFPLVNFVPLLLVVAGQAFGNRLSLVIARSKLVKLGVVLYLMLHFSYAVGMTQFNRNVIVNNLTKFLHTSYQDTEVALFYYGGVIPLNLFKVHLMSFYYNSAMCCTRLSSIHEIQELKISEDITALVWFNEKEVKVVESHALLQSNGFKQVYESTPVWMQWLYKRVRGQDKNIYNEVLYVKTNRESEHPHDQ